MPVNTEFAQGVDLSKWNVSYNPHKKPVDFAIIKASEGTAKDPKFKQLLSQCAPLPVRGAYHYYRSQVAWEVQAVNFLNAVAEAEVETGVKVHFLAVDYERGNNVIDKRSDEELRMMVLWLKEMWRGKVLIYSQYEILTRDMPSRGTQWHKGELWWVARWWSTGYYNRTQNLGPGCVYTIWQYGGDYRDLNGGWFVPGYKQGGEYGVENDSIDLNAYNGTLEHMMEFFGVVGAPVDPAPEAPNPSTLPANHANPELSAHQRFLEWIKRVS